MKTIDRELDRMREKLYRTISQNGFRLSSDEVLLVSGKMDELILEYYRKKDQGSQRSIPGCRG
ncbi:MAG: aspartyl-phosphate phosphatase Spo0E family protein [Planifilum fimeticola]